MCGPRSLSASPPGSPTLVQLSESEGTTLRVREVWVDQRPLEFQNFNHRHFFELDPMVLTTATMSREDLSEDSQSTVWEVSEYLISTCRIRNQWSGCLHFSYGLRSSCLTALVPKLTTQGWTAFAKSLVLTAIHKLQIFESFNMQLIL